VVQNGERKTKSASHSKGALIGKKGGKGRPHRLRRLGAKWRTVPIRKDECHLGKKTGKKEVLTRQPRWGGKKPHSMETSKGDVMYFGKRGGNCRAQSSSEEEKVNGEEGGV